jgi:hypothetical protein
VTAIDRVLAQLAGVRGTDGRFEAKCPAHDDQHASLSVTTGDDGRVLLKCHAGCEASAIVTALHLEWADLFPPREGPTNRIEATYDYRDEAGTLLFQVVRVPPKPDGKKVFLQRRPDGAGGWIWKLGDTRRVLYRLPELKGHTTVLVPEGEKDVESLRRVGVTATCNSGGAGQWRDEHAQQLRTAGVECVAVLPDNDVTGEVHARAVARSCHAAGLAVKIVVLPGLPPKGDVSDYLTTHSKADLATCVVGALPFDPSESVAAPINGKPFTLTSIGDLLAEPDDQVEWVVEDRIPAGAIILLAGRPKAGKSTLARDLAFAVATGERWLGWRTHFGATWYLGLEDKRSEIRRHFRMMGATGTEPIRIFAGQAPSEILPALHALALTERPALIIVDTAQRLIRAKDLSDYAEVTSRFEPLLWLARETGATLVLLTHASTHADRTGLDAVLGSTALTGSADNVFVLQRTDKYRTLSSVQRIGPDLEPVVLVLNAQTGRVEAAGRKREADDREIGDRMLEALRGEAEPVTEGWIGDHVEGRNADKVRVLRQLLGMGRVERTGSGGRKDPYRYTLSRPVSCSRNSANLPNSPEGREPQSSSTPVGENLDFDDEVPRFPIGNSGNLQVRTSIEASSSHVASFQVPEVPEVPSASEKREFGTAETQKAPDRTESDSGSQNSENEDAYERL